MSARIIGPRECDQHRAGYWHGPLQPMRDPTHRASKRHLSGAQIAALLAFVAGMLTGGIVL
jgi:hypothetical protein